VAEAGGKIVPYLILETESVSKEQADRFASLLYSRADKHIKDLWVEDWKTIIVEVDENTLCLGCDMLQLVDALSSAYKVPKPKVVFNCERSCPHPCVGLGACYRHVDNALCFKTGVSEVSVAAHEFGHYLHHYVNRFHPFSSRMCDLRECEAFAMRIQSEWSHLDGVPIIVWVALGVAAIIGVAVLMWQVRQVIPEIPEWVPYVDAFTGLSVMALALVWLLR